jgi:1,4-alpha-glucan branching enzyme
MVTISHDGRVEFRFYRPDASAVHIAGDFDNWSGSVAMRPAGRGWWIFDAQLPAGEYRFRYVADIEGGRHWFTDFAAFGVEHAERRHRSAVAAGAAAALNSVLIVPEIQAPIERPEPAVEYAVAA